MMTPEPTPRDEGLVDAVAKAIYEAWNISGVPYDSPYIKGNIFREGKVVRQAEAAIAVVRAHAAALPAPPSLEALLDEADVEAVNLIYRRPMNGHGRRITAYLLPSGRSAYPATSDSIEDAIRNAITAAQEGAGHGV